MRRCAAHRIARPGGGWMVVSLSTLLIGVACTRTAPPGEAAHADKVRPPPASPAIDTAATTTTVAPVVKPTPAFDPKTHVTDPETLAALDAMGYDFGRVALGHEGDRLATAREYSTTEPYRQMLEALERDLRETQAGDRHLGVGMRHAHRLFDVSWLSSPKFRFELVGIVNRIDRRVFALATCGELRFVYRLAYRADVAGQSIASRAPMTINVVRLLPPSGDASCNAWLDRWRFAASGKELARTLASEGGLLHEVMARTQPKSVELNLQSVRWPSTVRPNMAGHAEYLLRVFQPSDSGDGARGLVAAALENTIDTERLRRDAETRAEFLNWLRTEATLRAVDLGTVLVPEQYLATRAVSFAPHGLARHGNRPYRRLLRDGDFAGVPLTGYSTFSDATSLLRRLDGSGCQGCHQTRSVAGFHFLGEDDPEREADAIGVAHSAHFDDELERRRAYLAALSRGEAPDQFRAPAERMGDGDYGAHCGLDAEGPFARWDCAPGLRCVRLNDPDVGQCQPDDPSAGDACELGVMSAHTDSHRDFVRLEPAGDCGDGAVCERNGVGFPGGMCSSGCGELRDDEVCGGIAQLVGFNTCLATQTPFQRCILEHTRPGALRRCSDTSPCREDYVCARLPSGEGGCIPPYFLFQLRVDGHVLE